MESDESISLAGIELDDFQNRKDQVNRKDQENRKENQDLPASKLDWLMQKTLHGVLFALSSDGDIIYTTDNVNQQLGLAQVRY